MAAIGQQPRFQTRGTTLPTLLSTLVHGIVVLTHHLMEAQEAIRDVPTLRQKLGQRQDMVVLDDGKKRKLSTGGKISEFSSLSLKKKCYLLTSGEGEYSKVLWCFVLYSFFVFYCLWLIVDI